MAGGDAVDDAWVPVVQDSGEVVQKYNRDAGCLAELAVGEPRPVDVDGAGRGGAPARHASSFFTVSAGVGRGVGGSSRARTSRMRRSCAKRASRLGPSRPRRAETGRHRPGWMTRVDLDAIPSTSAVAAEAGVTRLSIGLGRVESNSSTTGSSSTPCLIMSVSTSEKYAV